MKKILKETTNRLMLIPEANTMQILETEYDEIMRFIEAVEAIDVSNVEPMWTPISVKKTYLRPDQPGPVLQQAEVLANVQSKEDGFITIERVVK